VVRLQGHPPGVTAHGQLWKLQRVLCEQLIATATDNLEYFNYLGRMVNVARCSREIESRIVMAKPALNKNKTFQ
jgi:hypothetical protein